MLVAHCHHNGYLSYTRKNLIVDLLVVVVTDVDVVVVVAVVADVDVVVVIAVVNDVEVVVVVAVVTNVDVAVVVVVVETPFEVVVLGVWIKKRTATAMAVPTRNASKNRQKKMQAHRPHIRL